MNEPAVLNGIFVISGSELVRIDYFTSNFLYTGCPKTTKMHFHMWRHQHLWRHSSVTLKFCHFLGEFGTLNPKITFVSLNLLQLLRYRVSQKQAHGFFTCALVYLWRHSSVTWQTWQKIISNRCTRRCSSSSMVVWLCALTRFHAISLFVASRTSKLRFSIDLRVKPILLDLRNLVRYGISDVRFVFSATNYPRNGLFHFGTHLQVQIC